MIKEIKMPDGGQTTDKAVICKFKVKKGDAVKRGDILFEAETDKAILPVESFTSGLIVDILCKEGDTVDSETVVLLVGDENDLKTYSHTDSPQVSAAAEPPKEPEEDDYIPICAKEEPAPVPAQVITKAVEKSFPAMPNAKKEAKNNNLDLSDITPANGVFVKKSDVEKVLAVQIPVANAEFECIPLSNVRKVIAKRMLESVQTIPTFQVSFKIDMRGAIALKESIFDQYGVKISYNDIVMKCIAKASEKFPLLKSRFEDNQLKVYRDINIGLAVGLEKALLVPVVKAVNIQGLLEISENNKANIAKAKDGKLGPADMGNGTVTVSNLGMYGVSQFIAIVNPPENSIFALGNIEKEPVWDEDAQAFVPIPRMNVTASFDHRIIDGAYGADALKAIKMLMENPALLAV